MQPELAVPRKSTSEGAARMCATNSCASLDVGYERLGLTRVAELEPGKMREFRIESLTVFDSVFRMGLYGPPENGLTAEEDFGDRLTVAVEETLAGCQALE